MKIFKSYWLILFACALVISSCNRENVLEEGVDLPEIETQLVEVNPLLERSSSSEEGLVLDCFTVNYPFDLVDEDGETYTITSDEDFETLWEDDEYVCVDFVYPIDITYEDGETATIESAEDLGEAFASCLPQGGWEDGQFPAYLISYDNSCYEFVYPITLVDLAGEETVVTDEESFNGAVAEDLQFFVFPITLLHEDGEEVEVQNIDEIFDALLACGGWDVEDTLGWDWETGFEYIGCYVIEFPLDVELADGTIVTVNDHMELCDLMLQGEVLGYAYPLTLIDEEGNEIVVESEEELWEALEDCPGWGDGGDFDESFEILIFLLEFESTGECFSINYPITLYDEEGNIEVVGSYEQLEEIFNGSGDFFPQGMELPVTVTLLEDGSEVSIDSIEDVFEIIADCE